MMRRVAPRPKGPALLVTPEWKAAVEARRVALGMSMRELAKRVHTRHASVSRLLNTDQKTSRIAAAIAHEVGVPLPSTTVLDNKHSKWIEYGTRLRNSSPDGYSDLLEAFQVAESVSLEELMRRIRIAFAKIRPGRK